MKRKNGYRSMAVVLIVVLLMLCGCKGETKNEPTQTPVVSTAPEPESTKAPVAEDETDGLYYDTKYPVLKWAMVDTNVEIRDDIARAFNKALLEEGYEFQVEFVMCPVEEGANTYDTFINQTEGKVDLITVKNVSNPIPGVSSPVEDAMYELPIAEFVKNNMLLPLDDYVNKELAGIVEEEKDWTRCKYNGVIYGIPTLEYKAQSRGYKVKKEVFDQSGLAFQDIAKEWWGLDEAFETLYYANGSKPILSYSGGMPIPTYYLTQYDMISTTIGMIDGRAVNVFEQEDMRKSLEAWKRYREKGYITTEEEGACIDYYMANGEGKVVMQQCKEGEAMVDYYVIPYGEIIASRYTDRFTPGISVCSKTNKVEKAIQLINAVEKSQKLRRIMNYGLEGIDYQEKDNVIYKMNDSEFYRCFTIYGESTSGQLASPGFGGTVLEMELVDQGYTEEEVTTASLPKELSPYKEFTMDLSKYRGELEKMNELEQIFDNNFSLEGDVDEQLEKFNAELKKAGIDRVIPYINGCLEERNEN